MVFGGNRATGIEIVKALQATFADVIVMARPTADVTALKGMGVATVVGQVLNADSVSQVVAKGSFND